MTTLGNMSYADLRRLIEEIVDERLEVRYEVIEGQVIPLHKPKWTWDQAREYIEAHRWTPPPGAKSSLELLREDRDR